MLLTLYSLVMHLQVLRSHTIHVRRNPFRDRILCSLPDRVSYKNAVYVYSKAIQTLPAETVANWNLSTFEPGEQFSSISIAVGMSQVLTS